jgi:hypothetical protein
MTKFLFIYGAQKTATSTLCGIINCHPKILLLYEAFNMHPKISNYDEKYINKINALGPIMKNNKYSIGECYIHSEKIFNNNKNYIYFGGKLAGIDFKIEATHPKFKFIYTVRDLRTWIVKDSINSMYNIKKNKKIFTQTNVKYVKQFINTFRYKNCIRISHDDIVCETQKVISKIENFIDIELSNYTKDWHNKIGKYKDANKLIAPDWNKHTSSLSDTGMLDVKKDYNRYTIWNCILNIFDKYYNNLDGNFSKSEIDNDINILNKISSCKDFYVSFGEIY